MLRQMERSAIQYLVKRGLSQRQIAKDLGWSRARMSLVMRHRMSLVAMTGAVVGPPRRFGGYMGRCRGGPHGPTVLWCGLQHLVDLTIMYQVFALPPGRRKRR